MAHDLRTTLSPVYTKLLGLLLKLLPRSISAPALTALLATLASLFKHLLVPSIHLDLLSQTWTSIRQVLPKCLPEIQRAFAEVWGGSVLRRLKSSAREKAVLLMAEGVEGIEDTSAWMFVFACKVRSVSPFYIYTTDIYDAVCIANHAHGDSIHSYPSHKLSLDVFIQRRRHLHTYSSYTNSSYPSCQKCRPIFLGWRVSGHLFLYHRRRAARTGVPP